MGCKRENSSERMYGGEGMRRPFCLPSGSSNRSAIEHVKDWGSTGDEICLHKKDGMFCGLGLVLINLETTLVKV